MTLCDFEKDVIRFSAGLPQGTIKGWGAGLGAALEPLKTGGFLEVKFSDGRVKYVATQKGLDALKP